MLLWYLVHMNIWRQYWAYEALEGGDERGVQTSQMDVWQICTTYLQNTVARLQQLS